METRDWRFTPSQVKLLANYADSYDNSTDTDMMLYQLTRDGFEVKMSQNTDQACRCSCGVCNHFIEIFVNKKGEQEVIIHLVGYESSFNTLVGDAILHLIERGLV